jgi:Rab GDP dissociation inhibitor
MKVGKLVRAIAILSHPIPGTDNAQSAQIILPQKQIGRKNDMYVFCCSYSHNVCARDKWIAFVSTTVETTNPEAELAPGTGVFTNSPGLIAASVCWGPCFEVEPIPLTKPLVQLQTGLALLGPTDEKFTDVTDIYAPIGDGTEDKAFVSKSGSPVHYRLAAGHSQSYIKSKSSLGEHHTLTF